MRAVLVNLFDGYKHFDIAISEGNAVKMLMAKRVTVFHTKYEKNFISESLDGYECFDIAVFAENAGKTRMAKGGAVFHTKYEKNFLISESL